MAAIHGKPASTVRCSCLLAAIVVLGWSSFSQPARAQWVQLPSYRTFSVNTSVLVPDRGAAYLGGVNYRSEAISRRGVPLFPMPSVQRRSVSRTANNVSVSATIIDLQAMDAAVLEQARRGRRVAAQETVPNRSQAQRRTESRAAWIRKHVKRRSRTTQ